MSDTMKYGSGTHPETPPEPGKTAYEQPKATPDLAATAECAIHATSEALKDAGRKAAVTMNDLAEAASATGAKAREHVSRQVEEQPVASLLMAAAMGLVVGVLLTRR